MHLFMFVGDVPTSNEVATKTLITVFTNACNPFVNVNKTLVMHLLMFVDDVPLQTK